MQTVQGLVEARRTACVLHRLPASAAPNRQKYAGAPGFDASLLWQVACPNTLVQNKLG